MTATATKREVTLNPEQRLYVIPSGDGYTCWGFDNCFNDTTQLACRLGRPAPQQADLGTMKVYHYYHTLLGIVRENRIDLGTWFNLKTPKELQSILEMIRNDMKKVRVFYGETDPAKENYGMSWMDEHDMYGRIGRSMGPIKIPLLIPDGGGGGPGLLDDCIIKIISTSSVVLYEHPAFKLPTMEIVPSDLGDYAARVLVNGETHARFKTRKKAENWVAFMKGERMKP